MTGSLSGALVLGGLPALADETPAPEPTTPIAVENTAPDTGAPDVTAPADEPTAPAEEPVSPPPATGSDESTAPSDDQPAPDEVSTDGARGVTAPDESEGSSLLDAPVITPLAAGPDGGTAPYVYWETRNATNGLVGGATYQLGGPRTSDSFFGFEYNVSWNNTITVADCVSSPCAGPDLDPDPGEFLVKQIGSHSIVETNRYRVQAMTPPSGTYFVPPTDWREIPGIRNTPTGWSAQKTYDFGDFAVDGAH